MKDVPYIQALPASMKKDVKELAKRCRVSEEDVLKGSLLLFRRAVHADSVEIYEKENGRPVKRKVSFEH